MTVAIIAAIGIVASIVIYMAKKGILSAGKKRKDQKKRANKNREELLREDRENN